MLTVKGGKPSPFVRKVIVALEEKGIPYEQEDFAPFPKTEELLALNPMGKIPILQDGDHFVPDSSVIIAYLERLHPEPSVYPSDPQEYARALFIEEFSDTRMVDVIGALFFERFVKPHVFQQETDQARCAEIVETELPPVLDQVEGFLAEGATTILPRFSVADIGVGCQLASLEFAGEGLDASRNPKLATYAAAVLARPSFKAALPS